MGKNDTFLHQSSWLGQAYFQRCIGVTEADGMDYVYTTPLLKYPNPNTI